MKLLPLEFVASRSLSLMLMSGRKSKRVSRGAGHAHNGCFAEPNTAVSHFRQNGCSNADALFASSCAHHPAWITPRAALIAGASCGCRKARFFASITGSSSGRGSSFRSSLSVHYLHSAWSLSTLAFALTSTVHVSRKSTSCPLAVMKVVWCGHVHPSCFKHMMMAPVGPQTLLNNGLEPTNRCCRLHALCSSASSSCSSQTASAHATMGSTLHV